MKLTAQEQIALSIIIGCTLVALSIVGSGFTIRSLPVVEQLRDYFIQDVSAKRSFFAQRNIYGNEKAETIIVEFSDFECPYCAELHTTLKKIVDESDGAIAWEYRHLPLPMHPDAEISAKASECVASLTGNETFWKFAEVLMTNQRNIDSEFLLNTARTFKIDEESYTTCLGSEAVAKVVADDVRVAQSLGGSGTPFSVIVYNDGTQKAISGALPYAQWMSLLENAKAHE